MPKGGGLVALQQERPLIAFTPSPALACRFRRLHHGNLIATLLLYAAGHTLDLPGAQRHLTTVLDGTLARMFDVARMRDAMAGEQMVDAKDCDRLLLGGIATRMPRLSEAEALSVAEELADELFAALRREPLAMGRSQVLLREGQLVLRWPPCANWWG